MTKKELKEYCYNLYQLDWMRTHGYAIEDIIKELETIYQECQDCVYTEECSPKNLYKEFEEEFGFSGSLWVCFDEFCSAEFKDSAYIEYLLMSPPLRHSNVEAWEAYNLYYVKN